MKLSERLLFGNSNRDWIASEIPKCKTSKVYVRKLEYHIKCNIIKISEYYDIYYNNTDTVSVFVLIIV